MTEILAIVGPTASGKTERGLRWAEKQNGEIISVDSRQVYRFLSVGTAKPAGRWVHPPSPCAPRVPLPEGEGKAPCPLPLGRGGACLPAGGGEGSTRLYLVQGIPYHFLDFWDPAKPFSAADFVRLARETIKDIQRRGRKPILVGGTGLYLKALVEGLAPLPPADEVLRARLSERAEQKGRPHLHQDLARVDPEAAAKIPANNIARVIRALEVFTLTGKPISQWHREHQKTKSRELHLKAVGIALSKEALHERIEQRSRRMLKQGLIEETEDLLKQGYAQTCPALSGLGYPRVLSYLHGKISKDELQELLIRDTRHYAKRQMTWFRHQMNVQWKK